jgi:hypothetical protein
MFLSLARTGEDPGKETIAVGGAGLRCVRVPLVCFSGLVYTSVQPYTHVTGNPSQTGRLP